MNLHRVALAERTLGWLLPPDGPYLHELALEANGPIVEVGSYCGKSTVWLGDAAEQTQTVLISVDWHRGAHDMHKQPEVMDGDQVDTLPHLRHTLVEAGLDGVVVIVCATSAQAAGLFVPQAAMVFIDGAHDYASCKADVDLWTPHLKVGGTLAFHDYDYPEVAQVADALTDGWEPIGLRGCVRALRKIDYP